MKKFLQGGRRLFRAAIRMGLGRRQTRPRDVYRIWPVPGVQFQMVLDNDESDPVSLMLRGGGNPNEYTLELLQRLVYPGARVADLGSHVGQFALTAAALGCEVLAVEAAHRNADQLRASGRLNGFTNLHVVHCAVGAASGLASFCEDGPFGSVASDRVPRRITTQVPVLSAATLLEGLGWKQLALVKIDVEGYELEALTGLRDFLAGPAAPAVIYESNAHTLNFFRQTPGALHHVFKSHGYQSYQIGTRRLTHCSADEPQGPTCVDYLAVKGPLPSLSGWTIAAAFSEAELIEQFAADLAHPNDDLQASAACRLATAGERVRSSPQLQAILRRLRAHTSQRLRDAVAWHVEPAAA